MNVSLIGMPGVGKTYIGTALAERMGYDFIDTDRLMIDMLGLEGETPLQDFIERYGDEAFLKEERKTILSLRPSDSVVSTGGSVVYIPDAMEHLGDISFIAFLDAPYNLVEERIKRNLPRGIISLGNESLMEIYYDRRGLYIKYANQTFSLEDYMEKGKVRTCDLVNDIAKTVSTY